jgi:hypothetical protein
LIDVSQDENHRSTAIDEDTGGVHKLDQIVERVIENIPRCTNCFLHH